jgi:hypothetical protein
VTLVSGSTGKAVLNGFTAISSANSLVGSSAGDLVGNGGVTALNNGSCVVASPYWSGSKGAATLVSGTTGLPPDGNKSITAGNSLIGDHHDDADLSSIVQDPVNQTFLASFANDQTIRIGLTSRLAFATQQSQELTLTPNFLTLTLDTGTAVVLQAGNDITLNDPVNVSAGGHGGSLTLQAGRSIVLNASITTDNGNLTLIANDSLANGVIDIDRAGGAAVISMAVGASIDAGTGSVTIDLRDGAGKTYTASGAITLQSIAAGSLSISSEGPGAGGDIDLAGPLSTGSGNISLAARSGSIQADSAAAVLCAMGTVTLDAAGSVGTAASRIAFDAVSSPASVVIGATYQAGSVYLDGRGGLTLGNIQGSTASTIVDVTARTNLSVAANATIDSGTGTISLGADLTAAGAGDDGAGTLTIGIGAIVRSANTTAAAISLRGADMELRGGVSATAAGAGVVIGSSLEDNPMSVGGSDAAVDGINLTDAELKRLTTTSTGSVTFGDADQTGDLIFVTATTATTAGATTVVLQSPSGSGAIVLDEHFAHRAIDGNGGSVQLSAGADGIHVINPAQTVFEVLTTTAPANQTAVEGVLTTFSLGSFTDIGTTDGGWQVIINWGDNTASSTFDEDSPLTITPRSHVYAAGTYTATVSVTNDCGLKSNASSFQVVVSDPPVMIESAPGFVAFKGFATGLQEVGRFIDPGYPTGLVHPLSGYSVNVDWGDGSHSVLSSPANIVCTGADSNGNRIFSVLAGHVYSASGVYKVGMSVTDGDNPMVGPIQTATTTILESFIVLNTQPLAFTVSEGQLSGMQPVATFIDPIGVALVNGQPDPNAYRASIDWGDHTGSDSNTTLLWNAATQTFTVLGSHCYAEECATPCPITVTLKHGTSISAITALASVTDQPITNLAVTAPSNVAEAAPTPANFRIATFTDPAGGESISDYTASIDWGDGTPSVAGTVVSDGGGSFHVSAPAHTYAEESASSTITVSVQHDQLAAVSATAKLMVGDVIPAVQLSVQGRQQLTHGWQVTFTVSATQASATENAAGYSYRIHFGDGSAVQIINPTVGNGSGVSFTHIFPRAYPFVVSATATDVHGTQSAAISLTVGVQGNKQGQASAAQPVIHPVSVGMVSVVNGVLIVKGLPGVRETIQFQPAGGNGVRVLVDGINLGSYSGAAGKALSRIIASGAAQNETISVDPAILVPAELYGGPMNNTLSAGGGLTIEVGGAGINTLIGGGGRDILVGGAGSSTLDGMDGDDVLIAAAVLPQGTLAQRQKALEQALASWTSSASYSSRSAMVICEVAALIRGHTGTDLLTGGDGIDLFFSNLSLPNMDFVQDLQATEKIVDLSGKTH